MHWLSVGVDGDTLALAFRDEIDFSNSAQITQGIREAVARQRPGRVRLDLGEVTFLDSSGIGVLVAAMRAADAAGAGFRVERANHNVYDQLESTGLAHAFGMDP